MQQINQVWLPPSTHPNLKHHHHHHANQIFATGTEFVQFMIFYKLDLFFVITIVVVVVIVIIIITLIKRIVTNNASY